MVKNIFDPEKFEREGDKEYIIRGITSLNYLKSTPDENPPGIEKLPKQGDAVFKDVSEGTIGLRGRRMPINMHAFQEFIALGVAFSTRTENGYFISGLA